MTEISEPRLVVEIADVLVHFYDAPSGEDWPHLSLVDIIELIRSPFPEATTCKIEDDPDAAAAYVATPEGLVVIVPWPVVAGLTSAAIKGGLVHSSVLEILTSGAALAVDLQWAEDSEEAKLACALDPSVSTAMERALKLLVDLGADVETVDLGFQASDMPAFLTGLFSTSMGGMLVEAGRNRDKLTPYVRYLLDGIRGSLGPDGLVAAETLLDEYHRSVQEKVFMRGFQALIMPTLGTPLIPAEHGMKPETDTVTIDGKPVKGLTFALTWPWNLLGRYPVVSAPIGIGPENMPMGMQVIANTFDDLTAFQLAASYARAAPRFYEGALFPDFRG